MTLIPAPAGEGGAALIEPSAASRHPGRSMSTTDACFIVRETANAQVLSRYFCGTDESSGSASGPSATGQV